MGFLKNGNCDILWIERKWTTYECKFFERPVHKRNSANCRKTTEQFGDESLMVWGYIKSNGAGKLIKIDGVLNSEKYITLQRSHLSPNIAEGENTKTHYHTSRKTYTLLPWCVVKRLACSKSWSPSDTKLWMQFMPMGAIRNIHH